MTDKMQIIFSPNYRITSKTISNLLRIEAVKERALHLPLTPTVLLSLRESAKLYTTHYSTMIEGNRLIPDQIESVLKNKEHFAGRERDEHEVKGYYAALTQVERWVSENVQIAEKQIQILHALVMGDGREKVSPSLYRTGQNVIRDGRTGQIVYMPPEAKDVADLMTELIQWLNNANDVPFPILAGIAHYQFATIHPYYDGNGRTARLLTTLILHLGGYALKGLYSLEEYYARNLPAYYEAISVDTSHNYYMGRETAEITAWVDYFIEGMAQAFENVIKRMAEAETQGEVDQSHFLRALDPKQRRVLLLFQNFETVKSKQVGDLFGVKPRMAAKLCQDWVACGFLEIVDFSNKGRTYRLAKKFKTV